MKKIAYLDTKPIQFYKDIRIKADTGLHEQLEDVVKSILGPGSSILDFGAGEGALSQRLKDCGYNICSVDIDETNFKADTNFEKLDFNNPAEVNIFLKKNRLKYDLVLGIEVIEHVENPWEYIKNLKSLVKKGGHIVISTPNITSWYSRWRFLLHGKFHQFDQIDELYGHINPISENELRLICNRTGLIVERIIPGGWLPRVWLLSDLGQSIRNLVGFLLSLFMKNNINGWCIIAVIKKP